MLNQKTFILMFLLISFSAATSLCHAETISSLDLIHAQGCKGCHAINAVGGISGPSLDGVGNRLSREQIRRKLLDSKNNRHPSIMPSSSHMTEHEIDLLTDYLVNLR
jgi:mono/diheme cytochrome c family protein